jgi:hypothetical protein
MNRTKKTTGSVLHVSKVTSRIIICVDVTLDEASETAAYGAQNDLELILKNLIEASDDMGDCSAIAESAHTDVQAFDDFQNCHAKPALRQSIQLLQSAQTAVRNAISSNAADNKDSNEEVGQAEIILAQQLKSFSGDAALIRRQYESTFRHMVESSPGILSEHALWVENQKNRAAVSSSLFKAASVVTSGPHGSGGHFQRTERWRSEHDDPEDYKRQVNITMTERAKILSNAQAQLKVTATSGPAFDILNSTLDEGQELLVPRNGYSPATVVEKLFDMSQAHATEEPSVHCDAYMEVALQIRVNRISSVKADLDEFGMPIRGEPKPLELNRVVFQSMPEPEPEPEPEDDGRFARMCQVRENLEQASARRIQEGVRVVNSRVCWQRLGRKVAHQMETVENTERRVATKLSELTELAKVTEEARLAERDAVAKAAELEQLRLECNKFNNAKPPAGMRPLQTGSQPRRQRLVGPGAPGGVAGAISPNTNNRMYDRN